MRMLYAVIIDRHLTTAPSPDLVLPEVVAHNLELLDAKKLETDLNTSTVAGRSLGLMADICGYDTPHVEEHPAECVDCAELVREYCKHMLRICEREAAKRGLEMIERNMGNDVPGGDPDEPNKGKS